MKDDGSAMHRGECHMNARQLEGWALDRVVWTKARRNLVWGFFTSKEAADQEAARMSTKAQTVHVVPATLILPATAGKSAGPEASAQRSEANPNPVSKQ